MGAGTYTGIEAVSKGMPILREPKVATARKLQKLRLNAFAEMEQLIGQSPCEDKTTKKIKFNKEGKTAIILVSGFLREKFITMTGQKKLLRAFSGKGTLQPFVRWLSE